MGILIDRIETNLAQNGGKLSYEFTRDILSEATATHHQMTPNTRVCVITLESGHDLVGFAQVLNAENDIREMGEEIAYNRAAEKIWEVLGAIAKAL